MLIKPQRQLQSKGVSPEDIIRIDIITGGDHGKGAFVARARIVVALDEQATSEGEKIDSFSFEISVAEIICRKDNADILCKTIKDELTKGLDTLASNIRRPPMSHMNLEVPIIILFQLNIGLVI